MTLVWHRGKYPPAEPGALSMEPLEAAGGSLTRPQLVRPPKGGEHNPLAQKLSPVKKTQSREIVLPLPVGPRQVDRTLALYETTTGEIAYFGGIETIMYVDVIQHDVALIDPAFLL